jgi:MFS family permease
MMGPNAPTARRHGVGFWLIAFVFVTAMAFSTVPTPLYPLYQAREGFSTFAVTIVFAAYAVGVVASLLAAGRLSDRVGRKPVLLAALTLELAAAGIFLTDPPLGVLLVARVVSGLGIGMLTPTATAYLQELHRGHRPLAGPGRFETVSAAANIGGLGLGALAAGLLAQFAVAPLRLPFLVFAALLLLAAGAVLLTPETVPVPAVRPTYRRHRINLDGSLLAEHLAAFASFAVFGLFTSVAPGFVAGTLHHDSRTLAGVLVFVVFGSAALAQALTNRLNTERRAWIGLALQMLGLSLLMIGMHAADLATFVGGGVLVGAGAGILFKTSVAVVAAKASPQQRGETLSGLFLIAYLGLAIPAVGIGVVTEFATAVTALTCFAAGLLVLLGIDAVLALRSQHHPALRPEPHDEVGFDKDAAHQSPRAAA